jgi:hypothetical protein
LANFYLNPYPQKAAVVIPDRVTVAVLAAGLPQSSVAQFVAAFSPSTATLASVINIPGVNPAIVAAASTAKAYGTRLSCANVGLCPGSSFLTTQPRNCILLPDRLSCLNWHLRRGDCCLIFHGGCSFALYTSRRRQTSKEEKHG